MASNNPNTDNNEFVTGLTIKMVSPSRYPGVFRQCRHPKSLSKRLLCAEMNEKEYSHHREFARFLFIESNKHRQCKQTEHCEIAGNTTFKIQQEEKQ